MSDPLIAERGLANTRRNRRWLALVRLFARELGGDQDDNETIAWRALKAFEETR